MIAEKNVRLAMAIHNLNTGRYLRLIKFSSADKVTQSIPKNAKYRPEVAPTIVNAPIVKKVFFP